VRLSTAIDRAVVHPCIDGVYAKALENVNELVRKFEADFEASSADVEDDLAWFDEFAEAHAKLKNQVELFTSDADAAAEFRAAIAECETLEHAKSVLADIVAKFDALDAARQELQTELTALLDDGPPDVADQLRALHSLIESAGDT
jgi:hypothetical protein